MAAEAECERLLRDKSARARQPFFAQRVMTHALLAGSNRCADAAAREFPTFFPTIEDFLWLKLGLVRPAARAGPPASAFSPQGGYTLQELQQYLAQYPPAHYSHGGREPLLYAVVLLLSCQFGAAVTFLGQDTSARDYRLDAVHLGACVWHLRLVEGGAAGGARGMGGGGGREEASVGDLIHKYARSFVHADPQVR